MTTSIVIPNYNSPIIDQTIESVINGGKNKVTDIIIIGVDDLGLIARFPEVKFIDTIEKCPPSKARNIGVNHATGELIVFLDADCIVSSDWIEKLTAPFEDPSIVAVGGGVTFSDSNYWTLSDNLSMFYSFLSTSKQRFVKQLPSLNLAIRKDLFLQAGGFDESYPRPSGEDFALTLKLSKLGKLLFLPNAWIYHKPPRSSLSSLLTHAFYQGKYSTKADWRYSSEIHFPFRNRIMLLLASPLISFFAAIKVFVCGCNYRYFYAFPGIYLSKMAWCLGAATSPWLTRKVKHDGSL